MQTNQTSIDSVYMSFRSEVCGCCGKTINQGDMITIDRSRKVLCLTCSNLDQLVFLKSGNNALTIRSRKYSSQCFTVQKYSKARNRNERQGVLVEAEAIKLAQEKCIEDSENRKKCREQATRRRAIKDEQYVISYSRKIREMYPNCPAGREMVIAKHACEKYSGRVGRSAAAKMLDDNSIFMAVKAHIRHHETNYDELLMQGYDRYDARQEVQEEIFKILGTWM